MAREPDDWNDFYGSEAYADATARGTLYRQLAARLIYQLDLPHGGLVLDLACGTGIAAGALFTRVGPRGRVLGLDAARTMLAVASREIPAVVAAFVVASLGALPLLDASADGAICSAALWHVSALDLTLHDVARVLRPGACFAFNIPTTQLVDTEDALPVPLMLALARVGEDHFAAGPSAAGPMRDRSQLRADLRAAGFSWERDERFVVRCPQQELIDLLAVPAIAARMYPQASPTARADWIAAAVAQVDPAQMVELSWWQACARRC